jgi:Zn-finger nucleic acid-binding protein
MRLMELTCPVCDAPLDEAGRTSRCRLCEGAWISEETLVAILEQRASTLVDLPWTQREDKPRPCAECKAEMQTVDLGSVQLDRCPSHGVWFDADELASLLRQAKKFTTKEMHAVSEPKHGLLGKLAKLFGG